MLSGSVAASSSLLPAGFSADDGVMMDRSGVGFEET